MDVLTFETCWALNNEIKSKWHQVGLSLFNYQDDARSSKHKINNPVFILDTIWVYLQVADTYQSRYPDEATTSNTTDGKYHPANTATT